MTSITSAGSASGIDLESIISASLSAKRTAYSANMTKKETTTQTSLSGLSQLKSSMSTFQDTLDALAKDGAFNPKSITVKQDSTDPVLETESTDKTSNGVYNIKIESLATASRFESSTSAFTSSSQVLATQAGTLTFKSGTDNFDVTVKAGDTLANIRDRINKSGGNFGVSVNIINSSAGAKLVIESSKTGTGNDLTVSANGSTELAAFDTTSGSVLTQKQTAADAVAYIDDTKVTSATNTFKSAIEGLNFTALRVSDTDSTTNTLTSNKVTITTDTGAIKDQVNKFIASYNILLGSLSSLSKRSSIVGGVNQEDGGALEGDSMVRSVQNYLFNAMSAKSENATIFSSVFALGVQMDNSGYLSLDSSSTTFTTAIEDNPDQIAALFGGKTGLAATMSAEIEKYVQTGGSIADRLDTLNQQLSDINSQKADFETSMVTYETNLRAKYASLDVLLAKMKSSSSALTALSTSTTSSS